MIDPNVLVAQLHAMRAGLVANVAQVDAALFLLTAGTPSDGVDDGGCEHPQDKRLDTTTMGNPRSWLCTVCGHKHTDT